MERALAMWENTALSAPPFTAKPFRSAASAVSLDGGRVQPSRQVSRRIEAPRSAVAS